MYAESIVLPPEVMEKAKKAAQAKERKKAASSKPAPKAKQGTKPASRKTKK